MKKVAYSVISGLLVGFFVWFGSYQSHIQEERRLRDSLRQESRQVESLRDSVRRLERFRPYHRARVDLTTIAALTETKRPNEVRYVANVIRNRVEVCFHGNCSYFSVIADPHQFSGIWRRARAVVENVITARRADLPLSRDVLYFYSPRSMDGEPYWTASTTERNVDGIEPNRFRFYAD